jgi:hypothetical protein
VIKRNFAFPGAAESVQMHEDETPVSFFGATGPGTTPGPILGPGELASGPGYGESGWQRACIAAAGTPVRYHTPGLSSIPFLDFKLEPATAGLGLRPQARRQPPGQTDRRIASLAGAHRVLVTLGACTFRSSARFRHCHHFKYLTHLILI